jgi:hypothetical protein
MVNLYLDKLKLLLHNTKKIPSETTSKVENSSKGKNIDVLLKSVKKENYERRQQLSSNKSVML